MNIPPEAVQAAAEAIGTTIGDQSDSLARDWEAEATAALPHIRAQIAAEVRAIPATRHHGLTAGWDCVSQEHAARIVEGDNT